MLKNLSSVLLPAMIATTAIATVPMTASALTFDFSFDSSPDGTVTPPLVGTGEFSFDGDPGDEIFALTMFRYKFPQSVAIALSASGELVVELMGVQSILPMLVMRTTPFYLFNPVLEIYMQTHQVLVVIKALSPEIRPLPLFLNLQHKRHRSSKSFGFDDIYLASIVV